MLTRSSTELVRQQNSALVLAALRRQGALSHTELSARTGLASATVSAITAELERGGVLERQEQASAGGRGRPRVLFRQKRDYGHILTVRISSDAVQYSLADYAGMLIDRFEEPRQHADPSTAHFIDALRAGLAKTLQRSRLDRARVLEVSISSKGIVDPASATLVWSPVFGLDEIDFAGVLGEWRSVTLSNETLLVAHALGLRAEPASGLTRRLAALSLGHSVGLGIANLHATGEIEVSAPNFGHMLHAADGKVCRCGAQGCIEASAGFYGILRTAFEVPPDTIPAKFVPLAEMEKIAQRARQGHRMSEYAFRQAGLALGQGLSRVLSLYGSMPVTITGPGTRFLDLLSRGLEEGLRQSQQVRLNGMPEISMVPEEATLVFEGHVDRALTRIDRLLASERPLAEGETA
ncbi:predicted NBD/HSP70 family sugar kinase [Rhizobium subbaraonis]|uniref:Predicted NBD/HSP70 family sugar kinase n=1 Tax=Rhizobium subbaraonis TaxID=908946 RepID=A0A285UJC2_9HYPH|nr:ROK family transcriptional regulator [Rhizobium subbaraonis]SOC41990.1 predicted NBD/HSP70 family sugar kinase [Rhizobium subbaraonis]